MPNQLLLETRNINELKTYGRNSRKNDETIAVVAESIKNYGFQQPIVINKNNVIVAGHARYKAAQALGLETVPVVIFEGDKKAEREYRIFDNRVAENSDWDKDLLRFELQDLDLPTGFTEVEIEKLLGQESLVEYVEPTVFECIVELESEEQQAECYEFVKKELEKECRLLSI